MSPFTLLLALLALTAATSTLAAGPAWFSACNGPAPPIPTDPFPFPVSFTAANPKPSLVVNAGYLTDCIAQGYYDDTVATTGWGYLHIESNTKFSVPIQEYAAGYLEGYMMTEGYNQIYQSKVNTLVLTFGGNGTITPLVTNFIVQQNTFMQKQINAAPTSQYWNAVAAQYFQLLGIFDGYTANAPSNQPMSLEELLVLNLSAEVGDFQAYADPKYRAKIDVLKMHNIDKVKATLNLNSHCSALIRIAPDGSDLYSAHTTWSDYANMLRTYKYYAIGGFNAQHFSSYPACISSIDDYYQTSANMIVIETTNDVINTTLYNYVTPNSVPTFIRAVVSNQLATNGQDWANTYSQYNSGTYNNQWMVVDNKLFQSGIAQPGTLWIASQIPGRVESADVTNVLTEQGYWSSYNIPYFQDLWTELGYGTLVQQYGAEGEYLWSYKNSFRALIFARDAPNVKTIDDMQAIIQENNWQSDPLSKNTSQLAIASRMDLTGTWAPLNPPSAFGAIDGKLSSQTLMSTGDLNVFAKSGPTIETQPPFVWSTSAWASTVHLGQPDKFAFDWQTYVGASGPNNHQKSPKAAPAIMTE